MTLIFRTVTLHNKYKLLVSSSGEVDSRHIDPGRQISPGLNAVGKIWV